MRGPLCGISILEGQDSSRASVNPTFGSPPPYLMESFRAPDSLQPRPVAWCMGSSLNWGSLFGVPLRRGAALKNKDQRSDYT